MLDGILSFFIQIRDTLWELFETFFQIIALIVMDIIEIAIYLFLLIIETVLEFILWAYMSLDNLLPAISVDDIFSQIPNEAEQMLIAMRLAGFQDAIVIVVSALLLRLFLGLIPFIRIGR